MSFSPSPSRDPRPRTAARAVYRSPAPPPTARWAAPRGPPTGRTSGGALVPAPRGRASTETVPLRRIELASTSRAGTPAAKVTTARTSMPAGAPLQGAREDPQVRAKRCDLDGVGAPQVGASRASGESDVIDADAQEGRDRPQPEPHPELRESVAVGIDDAPVPGVRGYDAQETQGLDVDGLRVVARGQLDRRRRSTPDTRAPGAAASDRRGRSSRVDRRPASTCRARSVRVRSPAIRDAVSSSRTEPGRNEARRSSRAWARCPRPRASRHVAVRREGS